MDARAREKEKLFNELYRLDDADDDKNDPSPLIHFTYHPPSANLATTGSESIQRAPHSLARTVSAPSNPTTLPPSPTISILEITPSSSPVHSPNIKMSTKKPNAANRSFPVFKGSKKTGETGTKRKRAESFRELPESQKFFTGLLFYFFPNNDISPKRRARIRIAMERGAPWIKVWRDDVTHIIVDDSLTYKDLISFLKKPSLPTNIIIVNENYIPECMAYKDLVNPEQPQYQVMGHKEALKIDNGQKESHNTTEPATVSSSERSLVLKSDPRFPARGPQTPSRTDGSEQESLRQHLREVEARAQENQRLIDQQALNKRTKDALDDAIAEVMTVKGLPMDLDDDGASDHDTVVGGSEQNGSEDERKAKRSMRKKPSSDQSWQQNFNCMHKHDGLDHDQNPNQRTIEILQQMADYYDRTRDNWRVIAYRKVIAALRKQKVKIITREQALTIPSVGERIAEKIEEIIWTDKLRRLDNAILDPNDEVLRKFLSIYGVGIAQASTWIDQGYRTLEDLRQKAQLTKNQEIGLAHYEDFLARVPRKEVDLHGKVVRDCISKFDSGIQVIIGGSYRRGTANSGDIDFIITKPDTTLENLRTTIVDTVIPLLFNAKYLRTALAATAKDSGSKWHGAATVPGSRIWRRVDFLLVPGDELGAALIYFTGNDIFNRSIRLLASKKGMRLNQRGLYKDVIRGKNRERITQGTLVEGKSEKRIFDILGVPYRPPEHRIC